MATSIARGKELSAIGKARRAPSSNSHTTPTNTKRSTKPSTRSSSSDHKAITSNKQVPNYLRATVSSRFESHSHSIKHHNKSDSSAPQKPTLNRRPLLEKPSLPSKLPKRKEPSSSRLHKAPVSPAPAPKTQPQVRSSSTPTPLKSTNSSKPIWKRTTKPPRDAKSHPVLSSKSVYSWKTAPTTKRVTSASAHSKKIPKSADTTAKTSTVETVPQVTNQVGGVSKVEMVSEIPPRVDSTEHEHEQHRKLMESDQPPIEAVVERVIPIESIEEPSLVIEVEEAKGEPQEEKTKDEHGEEESPSQGECDNARHPEKHSATEEVEVKEGEEEESVITEEHEKENNNEEKVLEEREDERGISEDKTDDDQLVLEGKVEEAKTDSTQPKQEIEKESQPYNDVIEETATKLLETRKNKVRALAGAFQTVIDHQTSSK